MTDLWVFNHYASPPDAGVGTRHFDLATEMAAHGVRTTIFASAFSHFTGRDRLGRRRLSAHRRHRGVDFVWVRTVAYRGNTWRRVANMLSYAVSVTFVQLRYPRPDVVIGSSVHPFAALAGWIVARQRRARFVYEIRDLWPQTLIDIGAMRAGSLQARVLRWIESFLVERAWRVITVLPGTSDYLEQRGLPTDHVVYVPNGVRLGDPGSSEALPEPVATAFEQWRAAGRFVAVYAGSHGLVNGLGVILEAATLLDSRGSPVQVALVGDGPDKPALMARARELGLRNVTFLDPVPKAAVQALLAMADATLFHLADADVFRYGISSNKLFDYLASGKPVVFACASSNNPVADARAGRWIAPEDPAAMADALEELSRTDPGVLAEMGDRGRRHVAEHHDIALLARKVASIVLERPEPDPIRDHG